MVSVYSITMNYLLENVTLRLGKGAELSGISLGISSGEVWAIVGPNGSGKSALGRCLAGELKPLSGTIAGAPEKSALLSFETHLAAIERELYEDDTDFLDRIDTGRSLFAFLLEEGGSEERARELASWMGLTPLLSQGLRFLSTGEIRKTLLVKALISKPSLLVLDDPYCGLDEHSRGTLSRCIDEMAGTGTVPVLVLGRSSQMPSCVTHVAEMASGALVYAGAVKGWHGTKKPPAIVFSPSCFLPDGTLSPLEPGVPLIQFKDVHVAYGEKRVIHSASFEVQKGENWLITGPNGSGKSTLLSMINADNPKAYGQNISLFGRRKGSGESIWEIKKRIGYLSAEFQINYRASATPFSAILSGLADSIGTYRRFSPKEKEAAMAWLDAFAMVRLKDRPLRSLSAGQQRMVLMARAMIKRPDLLILDEPCQGLDDANAEAVLELANAVGHSGKTTLLYVTHTPEEMLPCVTHHLQLLPNIEEGSRLTVERLSL